MPPAAAYQQAGVNEGSATPPQTFPAAAPQPFVEGYASSSEGLPPSTAASSPSIYTAVPDLPTPAPPTPSSPRRMPWLLLIALLAIFLVFGVAVAIIILKPFEGRNGGASVTPTVQTTATPAAETGAVETEPSPTQPATTATSAPTLEPDLSDSWQGDGVALQVPHNPLTTGETFTLTLYITNTAEITASALTLHLTDTGTPTLALLDEATHTATVTLPPQRGYTHTFTLEAAQEGEASLAARAVLTLETFPVSEVEHLAGPLNIRVEVTPSP